MTNMLVLAYRSAWIKERKLHLCWRAIARRNAHNYHVLRVNATSRHANIIRPYGHPFA